MGRYYNRSRSPVSLALPDGRSVGVAPKSWIEVDSASEGAPDLIAKVSRGDLVASKLNKTAGASAAPSMRNGLVELPESEDYDEEEAPPNEHDMRNSPDGRG